MLWWQSVRRSTRVNVMLNVACGTRIYLAAGATWGVPTSGSCPRAHAQKREMRQVLAEQYRKVIKSNLKNLKY